MPIHIARDLKMVPTASLIGYERNARTHSTEQIEQIAASIREFGFTAPILVDGDKGIIAGHGRLAAAKKLGMTEVPVIQLAHLTPAQKRAYVIADNKLAMNAGWNIDLLQLEVADLGDLEFDLSLIGFSDEELQDLLVDGEVDLPESISTAPQPEEKKTQTLNNVIENEAQPAKSSAEIADEHWHGMPEFKQDDKMPHRTLYVHFESDDDISKFASLVAQQITEKTKYIWYPAAEKAVVADKAYVAKD